MEECFYATWIYITIMLCYGMLCRECNEKEKHFLMYMYLNANSAIWPEA